MEILEIKLHAEDKLTAGGIICSGACGARSQTVGLERRGIHAAVFGDGEEVLGRKSEADVIEKAFVEVEGIP